MAAGEKLKAAGGKLKAVGQKAGSVFGGAWKVIKYATLPARLALWPVYKPVTYGLKKLSVAGKQLEVPARTAREGVSSLFGAKFWGKGKEKPSILKATATLLAAPFICIKKNIIDNTRSVIKGIFKTPGNILRTPGKAWEGLKMSTSNTRKRIGKVVENVRAGQPFRAIGNIAAAGWNMGMAPVRMITKPARHVLSPVEEVGTNIYHGFMAYPHSVHKSSQQVRGSITRTLGSYGTAKAEKAAGMGWLGIEEKALKAA